MTVVFAGDCASMELRHFVWISDAAFFMGSWLWSHILRVSGPFVTALAFACIGVLSYYITACSLFLHRADVVGLRLASRALPTSTLGVLPRLEFLFVLTRRW